MDLEPTPAAGEDRSLALALVNTLVEGSRGTFDRLAHEADVKAWLRSRGFADITSTATESLTAVTELRSDLRALLRAIVNGSRPSKEVVRRINGVAGVSLVQPKLIMLDAGRVTTAWQPVAAETPATTIARDLVTFLGSADAERLRICAAEDCDRVFIQDHGRRIWCTPACGNRMRVQRHAARRRQVTAP